MFNWLHQNQINRQLPYWLMDIHLKFRKICSKTDKRHMEKQMHYFSWTRCTFLYIEQSLIYGIILLTTTVFTHLYFRWHIAEYNLINGMCSCLHECCRWFFLWQNTCIYCQHSSVVNDVLNESCTYLQNLLPWKMYLSLLCCV